MTHAKTSEKCFGEEITDIRESADHEFTMAAIKFKLSSPRRALRSIENLKRLSKRIDEISAITTCNNCVREIENVRGAIREFMQNLIELWGLDNNADSN